MTRKPSPFGDFPVRVDPWDVDYGDQTPLAPSEHRSDEQVRCDVEVPEARWAAITPSNANALPERIVFIDGIRRLEARIIVRQGEQLIHGGFGSHAVGAVALRNAHASFEKVRVFRTVVLGSGRQFPVPVHVREGLVYEARSTESTEADGALRYIQKAMRRAEATLARDLGDPNTLTIVDGPLSFEPERPRLALGYIKRVHELYLSNAFIPLLATMPAGARTPIFLIQSAKAGFSRYAWFQRLAEPDVGATELHGLVRLEVATNVGIETARSLADAATTWLPETAPKRARDPRSPQNLLPIGAIEQRMRGELGDARLVRRWIETLVAREVMSA